MSNDHPSWWDPAVAAQYDARGYPAGSATHEWWSRPTTSQDEIQKAIEYRDKLLSKRVKFSPSVESALSKMSKNIVVADIETGGLHPTRNPIYEQGFMHGIGADATFHHSFVKPTDISGSGRGEIDAWSKKQMAGRGGDAFDFALSSGLSQSEAAREAFGQMGGKHVLVQNMRHEREAWQARLDEGEFRKIAENLKLESASNTPGLYPTSVATKRQLGRAGLQGRIGTTDQYLGAWEEVFKSGILPSFTDPKTGMTQASDLMDLTKSVYAMAQRRGMMSNAKGELFTGTSVEAFLKGMYNEGEHHIALLDDVAQGEMFHHMMGAGMTMASGEELPQEMVSYFNRVGDTIAGQKQRNTVKNIVKTYQDQQKFIASQAEGNPDWDLLKGSRINDDVNSFELPIHELQPDGTRVTHKVDQLVRTRLHPSANPEAYTTDINKLVEFWKSRAAKSHGVQPDYDAALAEARKSFIDPFEKQLSAARKPGVTPAEGIRTALETMAPAGEKLIESLEAKAWAKPAPPPPPTMGAKFSSFIKNNWKIGLAGAGLIFAANLISGDDDSYNYIEGMRHGGIAGGSRKSNTDFGSGWQGLKKIFGVSHNSIINVTGEASSIITRKWGNSTGFASQSDAGWAPARTTEHIMEDFAGLNSKDRDSIHKKLLLAEAEPTSPIIMNLGNLRAEYGSVKDLQAVHGMSAEDAKAYSSTFMIDTEKERAQAISRAYRATLYHESIHARGNNRFRKMGEVPDSWAKVMERSSERYRENPDGWFEEYLAYGAQHIRFPGSIAETDYNIHSYFRDHLSAKDDVHNLIEGLRHYGFAGELRKYNTDFGSGWNALRGLVRAGETFADMLGSSSFREAIEGSSHVRELGEGVFGRTHVRKASFRGQDFEFVRKVVKPERASQVDMLREASYSAAVSESVAPDIYGASKTHIDSELFHGRPLKDLNSYFLGDVPESLVDDAIGKVHEQGIFHNDLNPGNMMYIPEEHGPGRIGIIDFGHFGSGRYSSSDSSFRKLKASAIPGKGIKVEETRIGWDEAKAEDLQRGRKSFRAAKSRGTVAAKPYDVKVLQKEMAPSILGGTVDPLAMFETLHFNSFHTETVAGRPATNIAPNLIAGLPEQGMAKANRLKNTGGQFGSPWQGLRNFADDLVTEGSPWQGLIKFEPEVQNALWKWLGRDIDAAVVSNFTKQSQRNLTEHILGNRAARLDPGILPEEYKASGGMLTKADYHQMRRDYRKKLPKFVQRNVRNLPTEQRLQYAPTDPDRDRQAKLLIELRQARKANKPFVITNESNIQKTARYAGISADEYRAGVMAHENVHLQAREHLSGGMVKGEVPEQWSNWMKQHPAYKNHPDHWAEEFLTFSHQYHHYTNTIDPPTKQALDAIWGRPNRAFNPIEGFSEEGFAGLLRKYRSDFGSPWQGLRVFASDVIAEGSEQYALYNARQRGRKHREHIEQREEERDEDYVEGINPYFDGNTLASIDVNDFAVEDADTIRMFMSNGQETSIRLAGIDAPEIQHESDDGSRVWPDQPYGQEAKARLEEILAQQSNLKAVMDPNATETYGRPVAMLIGDQGQNINLQLVREGMAASLPFGKRSTQITNPTAFNRAERDAAAAQEGMWSVESWQIAREMQMNSKRKITNVSYTDLGRLFSDFKTASVLTRMRNPDTEFSEMEASGGRDDFNTIEGLRHGWVGANRKANLGDFGSPYIVKDTIPVMNYPSKTKKSLSQAHYLANTRMRQNMKRENIIRHHRG